MPSEEEKVRDYSTDLSFVREMKRFNVGCSGRYWTISTIGMEIWKTLASGMRLLSTVKSVSNILFTYLFRLRGTQFWNQYRYHCSSKVSTMYENVLDFPNSPFACLTQIQIAPFEGFEPFPNKQRSRLVQICLYSFETKSRSWKFIAFSLYHKLNSSLPSPLHYLGLIPRKALVKNKM